MFYPTISAPIEDARVDTSAVQTLVVVGQSNDATAGLYKDLRFLTHAQIDTKFGADSHLAAILRDVITVYSDSITKPRIWAASYIDVSGDVARILEATVSGTATKDCTLKINVNGLNPDRTTAQIAAIAALRQTTGAACGAFTVPTNPQRGLPNNVKNFTPILAKAATNDIVLEISISTGDNAATIAGKINTAINASTRSIYSSSVLSAVVTLTCEHKGVIGNMVGFEPIPSSFRDAGFTISTVEDTAGTGVPDITAILNLTDEDGVKLGESEFNHIVLPYGYSDTALKNDSFAKFSNVKDYANKSLQYLIYKGTAIDTSNTSTVNGIASANPVEEKGVVKNVILSRLSGLTIKPVISSTESEYIRSKQLNSFLYDNDLGYTLSASYTLSNSTTYQFISSFFAIAAVRKYVVEKKMKYDFFEKSTKDGNTLSPSIYTKSQIINILTSYFDVLAGLQVDAVYGSDYSNIIDDADQYRQDFLDALNAAYMFDRTTGVLTIDAIYTLLTPIIGIIYPQKFK